MLLTCHHHHPSAAYLPYSSSTTHSLCTTAHRNCNNLFLSLIPSRPLHLSTPILNLRPSTPHRLSSITAHADDPFRRQSQSSAPKHVAFDFNFDFDSFLSLVERSCLFSSAIISAGVLVITGWKKELLRAICDRAAVWGLLMLVVGALAGAWIRRRQWRERVLNGGFTVLDSDSVVNLLERIEKLEDDARSSATVVRVLSRQLEKLGIRFRLTRKTIKEPITETAILAQKNSEAARTLAVQSEILEKELGEIQQVLLAMQEQQQKQLDLILAIAKAGKLWESMRATSEEHDTFKMSNSAADEVKEEIHQI